MTMMILDKNQAIEKGMNDKEGTTQR